MTHNLDTQFYRVVATSQPHYIGELVCVLLTLQNMKGEKQEKKIVFNDMFSAWEFYNAQQKMIIKQRNK